MRCTASRFQDHNPCVSWPNSGVDRLADERGLRVAGPLLNGYKMTTDLLVGLTAGSAASRVECGRSTAQRLQDDNRSVSWSNSAFDWLAFASFHQVPHVQIFP